MQPLSDFLCCGKPSAANGCFRSRGIQTFYSLRFHIDRENVVRTQSNAIYDEEGWWRAGRCDGTVLHWRVIRVGYPENAKNPQKTFVLRGKRTAWAESGCKLTFDVIEWHKAKNTGRRAGWVDVNTTTCYWKKRAQKCGCTGTKKREGAKTKNKMSGGDAKSRFMLFIENIIRRVEKLPR